jgi:hypothetical protein
LYGSEVVSRKFAWHGARQTHGDDGALEILFRGADFSPLRENVAFSARAVYSKVVPDASSTQLLQSLDDRHPKHTIFGDSAMDEQTTRPDDAEQ